MGVLSYTVVLERVSASFVVDGNTGATLFEFCCAQYVFASVFPVFFSSSCLLLFLEVAFRFVGPYTFLAW